VVSGGAPLDFYFDFSSPYGYLASTQIEALAGRHGRAVVWRPILLGVIFKTTGQSPLAGQPVRGPYHMHDFARSARRLAVPFALPDPFPFQSLAAARATYALEEGDPRRARLARAVYAAAFGAGRDVRAPEAVAEIAAGVGLDADATLAAMQDPAVKERLRTANEAAMARGVFGSPFVFVDGEPFWGSDRLAQVEEWLQTGGW
jgi:2-hydroxychromene-2-carboxylate isomerase